MRCGAVVRNVGERTNKDRNEYAKEKERKTKKMKNGRKKRKERIKKILVL